MLLVQHDSESINCLYFVNRYDMEVIHFDQNVRNAKRRQMESQVLEVRLECVYFSFLIFQLFFSHYETELKLLFWCWIYGSSDVNLVFVSFANPFFIFPLSLLCEYYTLHIHNFILSFSSLIQYSYLNKNVGGTQCLWYHVGTFVFQHAWKL